MEYESAYKRTVEAMFETALNTIQAGGRHPTPWQAECLIDALSAMSINSWALAEDLIISARLDNKPRKALFAGVTVDSLRTALAESKRRRQK